MTLCFDYNRLCRRRGLQKKRDFADFQKLSMSRVELDINGLIGLIVRGDIRQLRELLNSKPELSDEREESSFNTPLHVASSRGQNYPFYALFYLTFLLVLLRLAFKRFYADRASFGIAKSRYECSRHVWKHRTSLRMRQRTEEHCSISFGEWFGPQHCRP